MWMGWCAIASAYTGGRCQMASTTLKIMKQRAAPVTHRAAGPTTGQRRAGRSIQPGVPMMSMGGATRVSTRCCTMCALKR